MEGTAAVSADYSREEAKRLAHAARLEKKRKYMADRYMDPEFRAAKKADMLRRYHLRVPDARWGTRGRRPARVDLEDSDDAASGASTPRIQEAVPAAAVILAGAALGAAVAAML